MRKSIIIFFFLTSCYTVDTQKTLDTAQEYIYEFLPNSKSIKATSIKKEKYLPENYHWWQNFRSRELNYLVEKGIAENLDIADAWQNLRALNLTKKQRRSSFFPFLSGKIGYDKSRSYDDESDATTTSSSWDSALNVSYETDIWGKVYSNYKSASHLAKASEYDYLATKLTISANIANSWVDYLRAQKRLEIFKKQLKSNQTILDLVQLRFDNSEASALDVLQQRQNIAGIKSNIPDEERDLSLAKHQLNLLTSDKISDAVNVGRAIPDLPKINLSHLPAKLLVHRPDVQASFARLLAGDWDISASKADLLPSLTIGGNLTSNATKFSNLFNSWAISLATDLAQNIFQAGNLRYEVSKQQISRERSLNDFKQTLLTAYKEAEDNIVIEKKLLEKLKALNIEYKLAEQTQGEAFSRYVNGLDSYLNVINSLTRQQNIELNLVNVRANLLKNRINLHQALGGAKKINF